MDKRNFSILLLAVVTVFFAVGCTPQPEAPEPMEETESMEEEVPMEDEKPMDEMSEADEIMFTVDEVAQFNGKDGQKAYVIYDGYVYDVTDHPQWQSGTHGGNAAGTDITDKLDNVAPHGKSKLSEILKVGKIGK